MKLYEKPKMHVVSFHSCEVLTDKSDMIDLPIRPRSVRSECDTDVRSDLGNPIN